MTYGEMKKTALRLVFAEPAADVSGGGGFSGREDYIAAIPSLVDSALTDAALRTRSFSEVCSLSSLPCEERDGWRVYTLPDDLADLSGACILLPDMERTGGKRLGEKLLAVSEDVPESALLEYSRLPQSVGPAPDDGVRPDGSDAVHSAIPYFIAAQLVLYDDPYRYAALRNEYEKRLLSLGALPQVCAERIYDVYGTEGGVL